MNSKHKYTTLLLLSLTTTTNPFDWHKIVLMVKNNQVKSRPPDASKSDTESEDGDNIGSLSEFIKKHTAKEATPLQEKKRN